VTLYLDLIELSYVSAEEIFTVLMKSLKLKGFISISGQKAGGSRL
jgi:hypothetical protein